MSHITRINESRHTYEWGMQPLWRRGVCGHTSGFWQGRPQPLTTRQQSLCWHSRWKIHCPTMPPVCVINHLYVPIVCRRPQPLTTRQQSFCWHSRLKIYCLAMPTCMCLESFVCGVMLWLVHVYVLIHSDMCYDAFMEFIVRQYHLHLPYVVHV